MREEDMWKDYNKIINFDYQSLYSEIHFLNDDMIREINKKRLKESRIEKLKRISENYE